MSYKHHISQRILICIIIYAFVLNSAQCILMAVIEKYFPGNLEEKSRKLL